MPKARINENYFLEGLRKFLSPLFLLWTVSVTTAEPSISELAGSKAWLKLLHYKSAFTASGFESQVDGSDFYLCANGKSDPVCELKQDISDLQSNRKDLACRFPARLKWLVDHGLVEAQRIFVLQGCREYQDFKQKLSAKSVSLIFSSHYLNNPSSAFGHTFLRFNKEMLNEKGERMEFLDQAIDYSADVDTPNAIVYAYRGIFGYFKGRFSILPYFVKVKQYASFESRDLWSYDLAFQPNELQRLIDHLWELGQTYLFYYYFDENCSYHMLSVLEAAKPDLELTDKLPFYVIPTDTLRVLNDSPGLVRKIHFRPSLRRRFYIRWNNLQLEERATAKNILNDDFQALQGLSPLAKARSLDSASDQLDFKFPYDIQDPQDPRTNLRRKILRERAKLSLDTPPPEVPLPEFERPDRGHASRRFSLASSYDSYSGPELELQMRAALHDTLDPSRSFPKMSQIEFGNIAIGFSPRHQSWSLNEGSLFRVESLAAIHELDYPLAWRMDLGARTIKDSSCDRCITGFFELGGGYAVSFFDELITASAMIQTEVIGSTRLQGYPMSPAIGPRIGFHFHWAENIQSQLMGIYRYRLFLDHKNSWQGQFESRYAVQQNFSIGAWYKDYKISREAGGGLYVYF